MVNTKKYSILRTVIVILLVLSMIIPVSASKVTYSGGMLTAIPGENTRSAESSETSAADDDDEDWDEWSEEENANTPQVSISTEFTPEKAAENDKFILWYDSTGADIYLLDKRTGKLWSNVVDDAYYNDEKADISLLTELFQVSFSDKSGEITVLELCDAVGNSGRFKLSTSAESNGFVLKTEIINAELSFDIHFTIDSEGLNVSIPKKGIKQTGENRLVSIAVMPYFGAARTDESGYLLIPDGCGALVRFNNYEQSEQRVYSMPVYGQSSQDMDSLLERDDQDIKNIMLPVYGIRAKSSGFIAAVAEGAENAILNVVPYGYQCKGLARAYYTVNYIYTESIVLNGKTIEQIMPQQELSDRSIKYFPLEAENCDYSGMAAVYRKYLEQSGVLKEKLKDNSTKLSIDFFMGVNKSGMFTDSTVKMTSFSDVKSITSDLEKSGIELEVTLDGWNDGGFTLNPTPAKASRALGGKSGLNNLTKWLNEKNIPVYLYNNFIQGNTDSSSLNMRNDIIRDYVGNIVSDKKQMTVMLNAYATLSKRISSSEKTGMYTNAGFSLSRVGQWLWNNYEKGKSNTRANTLKAYTEVLEHCSGNKNGVQVYGGNSYVLPYAASLREIPDSSSGYYITTDSVPFYQLVVSGYVRYTSIAGNMSYDHDLQKLRWIEYGSMPYYILTRKNAAELINSDYDRLFSSEYSVWGETIKNTYAEMKEKLSPLNGAYMTYHEYLTDTLVRVTYGDKGSVYINYGKQDTKIGNTVIGAMDYTVVSGGEVKRGK